MKRKVRKLYIIIIGDFLVKKNQMTTEYMYLGTLHTKMKSE